ncbi:MAG: class I SAM-dependent methyltransferase [Spirochaetales bacterium]|nr:class I SAM-dependent methyltransferase [Spirochaetales bacterium]
MSGLRKKYNFEFLDCGSGNRLERVGESHFIRQAPKAVFSPGSPGLWNKADYIYDKHSTPRWRVKGSESLPDFQYRTLRMDLRLSENGQIGIYPEQKQNWDWLYDHLEKDNTRQRIFNGFAYTGASSLVCAAASPTSEVCHLDASKAAVNWARRNREKSGLSENSIRFIVDDISRFLEREIKRGKTYSGMILDPPAFGRAKNGKTWVLKRDLPDLMKLCRQVLDDAPRFFLLSCHDPEMTKDDLAHLCSEVLGIRQKEVETLDLVLESEAGNSLPNGIAARWYRAL